jgi:hypothetical protein
LVGIERIAPDRISPVEQIPDPKGDAGLVDGREEVFRDVDKDIVVGDRIGVLGEWVTRKNGTQHGT